MMSVDGFALLDSFTFDILVVLKLVYVSLRGL